MRPRGTPPTPSARSSETEPVEMAGMSCTSGSSTPSRMTEPLPNCFSMAETASSIAFSFSAFATRSLLCAQGAITESLYRTHLTSSRGPLEWPHDYHRPPTLHPRRLLRAGGLRRRAGRLAGHPAHHHRAGKARDAADAGRSGARQEGQDPLRRGDGECVRDP